MSAAAEHHGPLDQFAIQRIVEIDLGGFDASFTNSAMKMVIAVVAITMLMTMSVRTRRVVPTRMQSIVESLYEMVARMLGDNVGPEGRKYFPFIFSLFMFLLFGNALGLIPYAFTYTSHIVVTFIFAAIVFRLFANMMAGHTMLHVFGGFVFALGFLGFAPFAFIIALYALESIVAFLQAYVFAILSCLYLRDAIHLHH